MGHEGISALTELEKEALRAYLRTPNVKEVAAAIERSPATVEQRLARARERLKVGRSIEAAHLLAQAEGDPAYGMAIYGQNVRGLRPAPALRKGSSEEGRWFLQRPFPTKGRPWNALPTGVRLAWIMAGVVALVVAAVLMVSLGEAASIVFRRFEWSPR